MTDERAIYKKAMSDYREAEAERTAGGSGQEAATDYERVIWILADQVERLLKERRVVMAQNINTVNM